MAERLNPYPLDSYYRPRSLQDCVVSEGGGENSLFLLVREQARQLDWFLSKKNALFKAQSEPQNFGAITWNQEHFVELSTSAKDYNVHVATGSHSGSLFGFAKARGLLPTGELLARDMVPFSGELEDGMAGVNQQYISFSDDVGVALEYSGSFTHPWTPEESVKKIKKFNDEKQKALTIDYKLFRDSAIKKLDKKIDIENLRHKVWGTLTVEEKEFISAPFPVVYGIVEKNVFTVPQEEKSNFTPINGLYSDILKERLWEGVFSVDEFNKLRDIGRFVIYVPKNKIHIVQDYLQKNNVECVIKSIEVLETVKKCRQIEDQLRATTLACIDKLLENTHLSTLLEEQKKVGEGVIFYNKYDFEVFRNLIANELLSGGYKNSEEAIDRCVNLFISSSKYLKNLSNDQKVSLKKFARSCFEELSN